jgi:hypothetical protein
MVLMSAKNVFSLLTASKFLKNITSMKRLIFTITITLLTLSIQAQTFERTYGGLNFEEGKSVIQTTDGNYIVAGWTVSYGAGKEDVYLVKVNADSDTLWSKTYGGIRSDFGCHVLETADNGFAITGYTERTDSTGYDVYLIKTDVNGDTLWTRTYGSESYEAGYDSDQTDDNGYLIGGYTESFGAGLKDIYLIKTDSNGDTLWTQTYGGSNYEEVFAVNQTNDGGYFAAGYTESDTIIQNAKEMLPKKEKGKSRMFLMKTDASGDTAWTKTYGNSNFDIAYSAQQTNDDGYILAGVTENDDERGYDFYLVKTDSNGDTLWTRTYGGSGMDQARAVRQTNDGGYIVTGKTNSFNEDMDVYVVRTNSTGDTLWTKTFGDKDIDNSYSVKETSDNGYIISGYTAKSGIQNHNIYLIRTDINGDIQQFQVNLLADPDTAGYTIGDTTYNAGNDVTITAVSDSLYAFDYWTSNSDTISTDSSYTFILKSDTQFVAHFTMGKRIYVEAYPPSYGNVSGGGVFQIGDTATVVATPNSGYLFEKWTVNGEKVSSDSLYSFEVESDINLVANFYDPATNINGIDEKQIDYFPNPVRSNLSINYRGSIDKIEILSYLGQTLKTIQNPSENGRINVNMEEFSPSIYLIKIVNEKKETGVFKIIKE